MNGTSKDEEAKYALRPGAASQPFPPEGWRGWPVQSLISRSPIQLSARPGRASNSARAIFLSIDNLSCYLSIVKTGPTLRPMTQDLIGVAEVAEILGVSRQRVHQLVQSEADFPKPEAVISAGRIWLRPAIEEWAGQHPRRQSSVGSPHLSGAEPPAAQ
jgi:predicted DNA-binding transcriptional regulator AlpA